jgi:hypothetical protein
MSQQESGRIVAEVTRNIGCCSMAAVTGGREHSAGCVNHVATDKPAPAAMKVPYAAREAGLAALNNDKDWHKPDSAGVWRANYHRAVELVLEAAAPLMTQPATGIPEQAVEVYRRKYWEKSGALGDEAAVRAALEAAQPYLGVRPVVDREAVERLVGAAWDDGNAMGLDGYIGPYRGAGDVDPEAERRREQLVDRAVLALLAGGGSETTD